VVRPGGSTAPTVAALVDEFVAAAEEGRALNRSGRPYRPSALRDLRGILRLHVVPDLGDRHLRDVRRRDIQALVDGLAADGLSESRIRSVISALRALYGYAIDRGQVEFNPADTLEMRAAPPPRAREPRPADDWLREPPTEPPPPDPEPPAPDRYEPIGYLPERILSLALRVALVVFVLIALVSLLSPA
jgi:Phage integrase, N-terminal SAM-like domain